MDSTVTLRSRSAQTLGVVMVVVSVAGLVSSVVDGLDTMLRFGAPLALFGVAGWGAFWQPHVEVSDGGVRVANTLRTIDVPWPAIESVDGRYGLRLTTAYGRVDAWGAAAPAGRQRARQQESPAARAVIDRLERLRASGHLDDPRLERPAPHTVWHRPLVLALGVLALASLVLPLLA